MPIRCGWSYFTLPIGPTFCVVELLHLQQGNEMFLFTKVENKMRDKIP